MFYRSIKTNLVTVKKAVSLLLTGFCLLMFTQLANSEPREVTWEDLDRLKNGDIPENATKEMFMGAGVDIYLAVVSTPRGRAALFAKAAKEEYIKLDTSIYKPSMFNRYVELSVINMSADKPAGVRQIQRGILVIGESVHEIDSVVFVKTHLQNAYGAQYINVDAKFYIPLSLFDGFDDIKIVIFDDHGKFDKKLKKKDIQKLE